MRTFADRIGDILPALGPAALAGILPVLFLPISVDAYVLPRTSLVILAGAGAAIAALWREPSERRGLGPLAAPALAVLLALLLATAFSVSPNLSLIGSYGRYESLPVRLSYLLLFCLPTWLLRSRAERRTVITAFLAGTTIAACEAIFEAVTGAMARPDGNLGQPNLLGVLLAMAIPIAAGRALYRPAWALLLPPLAGALLLSGARSAWLGTLAGSVALLPLLANTLRSRRTLAGGALLLVAGAVVVGLSSPLAAINGDNGSPRLHVWADSLSLIAARPLLGFGLDTQGLELGRHLSGDWEPGASFDRVHQLGLDLLATQGLAGFAATGWLWLAWVRRAVAALARHGSAAILREEEVPGLVGAWAAYLVFTCLNFDWAPATAEVWLLGGVAWSAVRVLPAAARGRADGPGRSIPLALAGTFLALAGAVAFGILPLVADLNYFRGNLAAAVAADPLQPRYHAVFGANLADAGMLPQGAAELDRADRLGEFQSGTFVRLGDARLAEGDRAAALRAYRRALQLDRFDGTASRRIQSLATGP